MTSQTRTQISAGRLIAILRGIKPPEVEDVVAGLIKAGFTSIEIPLNSPDPFRSIKIAAEISAGQCMIGAGTVLTNRDVDALHNAGGVLMVSPNVNPVVIKHAISLGMSVAPGVFTTTEALTAIEAGARSLKFFPASILGPEGISAIRAILPTGIELIAVGGVSERDFPAYVTKGITSFGLGSSLYKPGDSAPTVVAKAEDAMVKYLEVITVGKR
ncbi:MAG: 2-dehydro-3-deoxy-6-phosphogalactonate aldolase [Rhodobacteraceae bacterium]|nr:2-dehydro-3-deoxy-6-phosphogalactonate aldolase [Paracoccaceae bacterium]